MKNTLKRAAALLLCAVLLFSFAACTPGVQPPAGGENNEGDSTPANPELLTAVASDEVLDRFGIIYSYGSDPYEENVFWCEAEMTDVYIIGIMMVQDGAITDGVHHFDAACVKPGEAIHYKAMVPEGYPAEAIVYTANGETYMYAIAYNGRDGGVSLITIDKLIVDAEEYDSLVNPTTTTTTKTPTTTTTTTESTEMMIQVYWLNDELSVFVKEVTIESDSKWHVWRAIKQANEYIDRNASLLSAEMLKGRNGVMELDFSEEFYSFRYSMIEYVLLECIANTFIEAYDLEAVRFKVEGEYYESDNCPAGIDFTYNENLA